MSAFDHGRRAARRGESRRSNPYDHPDWQRRRSIDQELLASFWDEGWLAYDPEEERRRRSAGAKRGWDKRRR